MISPQTTSDMLLTYPVSDTAAYINWIYFFHAWGFQPRYATVATLHECEACRAAWLSSFPEADRTKAVEAMQLFKEASRMLTRLDGTIDIRCLFRLCHANADGDNLLLDGLTFPLLRQQTGPGPYLCLSDFVRPRSSGVEDTVGVFAASVSFTKYDLCHDDPYGKLLLQTLADRLAEAATEKMHQYVRRIAWGYAPHEDLPVTDLLQERFQGIRPAVGYPSLPDQSVNFLIDRLLDLRRIGVTLTENGAMQPHASVSGLMLAHPDARYFAVGRIGNDQLEDYAHRRDMPIATMRKFLAANL